MIHSRRGEVAELAEGGRLLSDCSGTNRYRGFESRPLRHLEKGVFCVNIRQPVWPSNRGFYLSRRRSNRYFLEIKYKELMK